MRRKEIETLIQYRLEQAKVALDDAGFLLAGERSAQSIINRAYYAMFYAALALLQKIGRVPSKHSGVISLFDTEFILKGVFPKELSRDFHNAFELRQFSDYRVVQRLSTEKANETLNKAERFVQAITTYLVPRKPRKKN